LGEIIGDEGSAYWIGRQCLNLFARMSDGRVPRGPLYGLIHAEASVRSADLELVPRFAAGEPTLRRRVAAFAPLAAVAAEADDTDALGILTWAGRELALLALTVASRLDFPADAPTRVSYSGSVFGSTALLEAFTSRLAEDERAMALQAPVMSPVLGAVAYAARENGDDVDLAAAPGRRARVT
jgi:N-acetylglucosamine kinase-like BadF-type ATPase